MTGTAQTSVVSEARTTNPALPSSHVGSPTAGVTTKATTAASPSTTTVAPAAIRIGVRLESY